MELWYFRLYNKQIEDITVLNVNRMLQQNLLEEVVIKKAIEFLQDDSLMNGDIFLEIKKIAQINKQKRSGIQL